VPAIFQRSRTHRGIYSAKRGESEEAPAVRRKKGKRKKQQRLVASFCLPRRMNYYLISGGLGSLVIISKLVSQSELSAKLAGVQILSPKSGFLNERAPGFCASVLRGELLRPRILRIMRQKSKNQKFSRNFD
jgi:hypothetical protein